MSFDPAAFFVRRGAFTIVAIVLGLLLGIVALTTIPRSEDPQFPVPNMTVRVTLPGATAADMEQLVARPIEEAVYQLDDVLEVESKSTDGASSIAVRFDWSSDPDARYNDVVREVNALRRALPSGVGRLDVTRNRTSETVIFQAALVSPRLPMRRLERIADELAEDVGRIPGVREARYWGAPRSELRVSLDFDRLAVHRIPAAAIGEALSRAADETPVGTVHAGERRLVVRQGGAFTDVADVRAVPVLTRNHAVIRVGDVADVAWATDEPGHVTRFRGQRALFVTATAKEGADIGALTAELRARLDAFERRLPGDTRLDRAFFQNDNVEHRLSGLTRDLLLAFAIVCLTLLPLGLRAASVLMVAIPLSMLLGLAALQWLGFGLNQLSIAGFVLSLGLLVDDSIVVTENIARRLRGGEDRVTAAIEGTRQILHAVAGCTGCLMLAFLPLMVLPGGSGAFIRSLPLTVLVTVGASFVVALTIIPFVASRFLSATAASGDNRLLRAIDHGIERFYRPVLKRALDRPVLAMLMTGVLCLAILPLFGAIGTSLFPMAQTPGFLVRVRLPEGAALRATDRVVRQVEARLAQDPAIAWFASNVGRGNPQLYYNQRQRDPSTAFGEIGAAFHAWDGERSEMLLARLRADLARLPGARISVHPFAQGPSIEAPVELRILGDDMKTLQALSRQAEAALATTTGIRDTDNPLRADSMDMLLDVDDGKAAMLGVAAGAARQVTQLALSGQQVANFRDAGGQDYAIRIRAPMVQRNEYAALSRIHVPGGGDRTVPLSAIAAARIVRSVPVVERFNRQRSITLTAEVAPGHAVSDVTREAVARVRAAVPLPPGYSFVVDGEVGEQAGNEAGLAAAALVAVLGIVAVLVLEFGCFRLVAVVAGIIPLGVLGAVTALWVAGQSLSFTAAIGIIALIGIEIKNSILLVDFTEQLRAIGVDVRTAIERAGEVRFLPVLLTSVTAIGGLLPLVVEGSALYAPMAIAMIGGLIASTLLSRIVTPVMYLLLIRGRAA